jgi:hypothetical protein
MIQRRFSQNKEAGAAAVEKIREQDKFPNS